MARTHSQSPKARIQGLLTEHVGDEVVVYDLESKDVHCLNPFAAAVFERCDGMSTPAQIAERLAEPATVEEVEIAVAQLQERALLEAPPLLVHNGGMSRRDLARRSAVMGGAIFAAPLIASIAAPSSAMALSGIPSGCTGCGKNSDCVSNHCCQSVAGKQCNQGCCVGANNSCHLVNSGCTTNCVCTVVIAGCSGIVCPPGTSKCCTSS